MRARRLLTSFAEQMGDHDDVRRNVEMMRRAWAREPEVPRPRDLLLSKAEGLGVL